MKKVLFLLFLVGIFLYSCKEDNEASIEQPQIEDVTKGYEIFDEPIDIFEHGLVTTDSVYCLFENNDSIDGYVCYIGQKKGKNLPLIVRIDTLGIIRSLFCDNICYDFRYKEETFDIIISSNNDNKTISDISYSIFNDTSSKSNAARTRATGSSNSIDGWADMASKISTIASIGEIASNPNALSSKVGVLTIIGGMSDNKYVRRSSIAVDLIMSLKNGGILGTVMGLYSIAKEWRDEEWFGDVVVTTLGAEHITDSRYRVYCQINNLDKISHPDIMGARIIMRLEKRPIILGSYLSGNEMASLSKDVTKDGVYYFEFDNLELGQMYCFQPHLYRTWTEVHGAAENMTVSDIFMNGGNTSGIAVVNCKSDVFMYGEIGTFSTNSSWIESITEKEREVTRGLMQCTFEIKGKGYAAPNNEKETLGQGAYGIYILQNDEYIYYPADKINGNDFSLTFKITLSPSKMDNIDWNNYYARKELIIGSYTMAYKQNGQYNFDKVYYYADPEEYEIVYDKKPSITINNIWYTSTEPYTEENDAGWDTHSNYTFSYELLGSFFFDALYYSSFGTSWKHQFEYEIYDFVDGSLEYSSGVIYKWGVEYPSTYYGIYGIANGKEIYPNNYIKFIGNASSIIVNSIESTTMTKNRNKSSSQQTPILCELRGQVN